MSVYVCVCVIVHFFPWKYHIPILSKIYCWQFYCLKRAQNSTWYLRSRLHDLVFHLLFPQLYSMLQLNKRTHYSHLLYFVYRSKNHTQNVRQSNVECVSEWMCVCVCEFLPSCFTLEMHGIFSRQILIHIVKDNCDFVVVSDRKSTRLNSSH